MIRRFVDFVFFLVSLAASLISVKAGLASPSSERAYLDPLRPPAKWLSEYRFFSDIERQIPNPGVVPYELNTPHFADYATLRRYLWLPEGRKISVGEDHSLAYPIGATLILNVSYQQGVENRELSVSEQLVESRLLYRGSEGWRAAHYIWDEALSDAKLTAAGGKVAVNWEDSSGQLKGHRYRVPNRNQCQQCHEYDDKMSPLGPIKVAHLNRSMGEGEEVVNQLDLWRDLGLIEGLGNESCRDLPRTAVWNDPASGSLDDRARAYLDMNCASCHRPGGLAYTSGLDLRANQVEPLRYGVLKVPVAAGRGIGKMRFSIVPGVPEKSMLLHRLSVTDPGIRMPIVGRSLVHKEGVELIREWIRSMRFPALTEAQSEADTRWTEVLQQVHSYSNEKAN